jgi:hypothetical protein
MAKLLNQSTTVQQILDQCRLHTKLQNFFVMGQEPGLTIANNTNQTLLAFGNAWKFNRVELDGMHGNFFVTQFGVQDYRHAGACAFALVGSSQQNSGGVGIDLAANPINGGSAGITVSGGIVTVQTLDPHPFSVGQTVYMTGNTVAAYNSTWTFNSQAQSSAWTNGFVITAVPDNLHFQFAAGSGQTVSSGAPGITNWGWMESASLTDINSQAFPLPVKPIQAVHNLAPTFAPTGDKIAVAMMTDYQNGVLKFRLSEPMGSYCYQVNVVYQARAPKLTDPTSVFQWPDNLSFVLQEVALWQAFRFATGITATETQAQYQMAQAAITAARGSEDQEDSVQGLVPTRSLME